MVNVKVENVDTVLDDLKSSLRILKGNLVESVTNKTENDEVNFNRNSHFNRSRSKSKSNQRFQSRSFDQNRERSHSRGNQGWDRDERGRNRERRSDYRNDYQRKSSQPRSNSRNQYSRERRGRSGEKYESVNLVFKSTEAEDKLLEEENDLMILDSGTTKTVAGSKWMENYLRSI